MIASGPAPSMRPMAQSTTTPYAQSEPNVGMWLWFLMLAFTPRVIILAFWVFGSQLGDAFGSWVVPVIGFVLAPSTTVAYAFMWSVSSDTVSGWEWIVVALGVLLDLWMWGALQQIRGRGR